MKSHIGNNLFLLINFCFISLFSNATNYYSDPSAAGSMSNDGSYATPWASLSSIFNANKTFIAGDSIFLRSGNHGYASIKGENSGFVVIAPDPGHSPILTRVAIARFAATSFWKLYKLTIQSESSGTALKGDYALVEIFPNATNITVSNCFISSNPITTNWMRGDWRTRCNWGLSTRDKLNANYIIEDNVIKNVSIGMSISSSNTIVRRNTVQFFTNDGSRVLGSNVLFEKNKILDLMKVMTVAENHDDLFQSFTTPTGSTGQQVLRNDTIRGNIFRATSDINRPFVGSIQGMGCFDGPFENWVVENNIVMPDSWHGISFYGATNCKIVNNTVLDPYVVTPIDSYDKNSSSIGPAWIYLDGSSNDNIIKNNLANKMNFSAGINTTSASNFVIAANVTSLTNMFVNVSNTSLPGSYDLHLLSGSFAVDAGDNVDAPLVDFDNIQRPQGIKVDVGAYEYQIPNKIFSPSIQRLYTSPNPFSSDLSISTGGNAIHNGLVQLFDSQGKMVLEIKVSNPTGKVYISSLQNLCQSVYYLKLSDSTGLVRSATLYKTRY